MAKSKSRGKQTDRDEGFVRGNRERYPADTGGDARRFLKQLDRRLQRFTSRIDALEERASRLTDEEETDLIVAVESLHRETLMLRSEIREQLAAGSRSAGEMAAYLEESWEQLKDSFEEIRGTLAPEERPARPVPPRPAANDTLDEEPWLWEEEWDEQDEEWEGGEVHPPRIGPKR